MPSGARSAVHDAATSHPPHPPTFLSFSAKMHPFRLMFLLLNDNFKIQLTRKNRYIAVSKICVAEMAIS